MTFWAWTQTLLGTALTFFASGLLFGFVTGVSATYGGRRSRKNCVGVGVFWGVVIFIIYLISGDRWYFYGMIPTAIGATLAAYFVGGSLFDGSRHRHHPDIYPKPDERKEP